MSKKDKKDKNEKTKENLFEIARKVLLAGIGAVALAQEEAELFINKLVEKGEIAEKDGKKLTKEFLDARKAYLENKESELGNQLEKKIQKMNIPTKTDFEQLITKIDGLTQQIEQLKKQKE